MRPDTLGFRRLSELLSRPVDSAILAYFRIAFGSVMLWEILRYFAGNRIGTYWVQPKFHFSYFGFDWVRPLPGAGLYWLCGVLALASLAVIAGFRYRWSAAILAVGFTYLFLIDQARYLNHGYLMCLLAWMSIMAPAHACCSIDALRRAGVRGNRVPAWWLWLLRFQVAVVYIYGGIAKLNTDWLRGEPMRAWLHERRDWPVLGGFFELHLAPWFFCYSGLLFDLLIVPALLWKRTRLAAFMVAILFHLTNSYLFNIGVFPWLAILLTALFFDPEWPRKIMRRTQSNDERAILSPVTVIPPEIPSRHRDTRTPFDHGLSRRTFAALCIYSAVQILVPLRHFLYPGDVNWTEEGHRFSWHMMLRSKTVEAASFYVINPHSGYAWLVDPLDYLTGRQFQKMVGHPDMIQQFCAHVGRVMREGGHPDSEVRAVVSLSLNDHPPALLIDPNVNLAAVKRSLAPATWILPLDPNRLNRQKPLRPFARGLPEQTW
ncbi:MAG: HTTM domain-containing protein [Verrucomicrobiales bacterium]